MQYPAAFLPDTGGYVVTFRDIPEAITQGDDEADALFMAKDALISAMDFYFEGKRPVPLPSQAEQGERMISLPASVAVKILLLNEMIKQKIGPSDLARRMGTIPQDINRLIDLHHATKIDKLEKAFEALGRRLDLSVC